MSDCDCEENKRVKIYKKEVNDSGTAGQIVEVKADKTEEAQELFNDAWEK